MTNPILIQRKINEARRIVARCKTTKPPKWALAWSEKTVESVLKDADDRLSAGRARP